MFALIITEQIIKLTLNQLLVDQFFLNHD